MSAILYNIGSCVYKPFGDYAYRLSSFDVQNKVKKVRVAALNRENIGNTRVEKINAGTVKIRAYRASNNYRKTEPVTFVDFREKKILESAGKASTMFRSGY